MNKEPIQEKNVIQNWSAAVPPKSLIFASVCCWLRELQMYPTEESGMFPHKCKTLYSPG